MVIGRGSTPREHHATPAVMGFASLLFIYVLGGLTFLPLLLTCIVIHAYLTFPHQPPPSQDVEKEVNDLKDRDDDARNIRSGKDAVDLAEKFRRTHEPDVASGYFAVCREYIPGGVNGKPPERTTPAGSTIAAESPSVYQSMYRSLFDRKTVSTLDPSSANGKAVKNTRNVFYVVLRHGHLMLYDNSEQFEVKYVISLELHDISVHGPEEPIPEGELWIKRNAIRLSRKASDGEEVSRPFFFFSENSSDKEDFYFALLQSQESVLDGFSVPPKPLRYEQSDIIGLVQKLHSSEEQLQTRWINGLVGRLFLATYKTPEVEDFVRRKITKKIARVKKPAFLSNIILQKIDMGDSAPHITNPRLKDFTIDGDCCVEADFKYSGHFRIEIATTARIDLGTRFRAREVNLVLAIVVKKLNGHGLVKFKPPPCNRIWISFENMPDMELSIEPIVSSRQITYGFILRTIESRIREVLAETMVLPHWDDSPFTDTTLQKFRGGIWSISKAPAVNNDVKILDEAPEDDAEADNEGSVASATLQTKNERIMSMPSLPNIVPLAPTEQLSTPLSDMSTDNVAEAVSTGLQKGAAPPKALRSRSFASAANPLLSMDTANSTDPSQIESRKSTSRKDATSVMMAISSKSRPSSPPEDSGPSSPPDRAATWQENLKNGTKPSNIPSHSRANSSRSITASLSGSPGQTSLFSNSPYSTSLPSDHQPTSIESPLSQSPLSKDKPNPTTSSKEKKQQTVAALNAATVAAKNWGWGVLNRNSSDSKNTRTNTNPDRAGTPQHPIGRGRPLPPLGQPLPFPDHQRTKTLPLPMSKRKPVSNGSLNEGSRRTETPPPPLPTRRRQMSVQLSEAAKSAGRDDAEGMLVVEAPPPEPESEPNSANVSDDDANGHSLTTSKEYDVKGSGTLAEKSLEEGTDVHVGHVGEDSDSTFQFHTEVERTNGHGSARPDEQNVKPLETLGKT